MRKDEWKRAFVASVPVLTGYIVLGIGFGVILKTKGYGVGWSLLMGVCIYAGSMQYVAINLLSGGASLFTAFLTTLAVNARHLFYGVSMVDRYKQKKHRLFLFFTLTDETYSLVCSEDRGGHFDEKISLINYAYWVTGCVLGSVLGEVLPFSTEGIDFALTALFLTVFVEQWMNTKKQWIPCSIMCQLGKAARQK